MTGVRKRSVEIAGHRTSVSIEAPFWDALREIALDQGLSINEAIARIDASRNGNLSSAIRLFILESLMARRGGERN